jgi:hypothetical protein
MVAPYAKIAAGMDEAPSPIMPATNPIESTFATVRHRTTRTRNCVSRPTFLGLAFKLIESAEQSWRRIRAPQKIASLLEGVPFKDGLPVTDSTPAQQPLAA